MKFKAVTTIVAGLAVALAFAAEAPPALAGSPPFGELHLTKDCSQYTFMAGGFCTIKSSNLTAIPVGAKVFYDQAAGIPTGMLDSNVLLYVGIGDWATGRCTVEASTGLGLCTFSDGVGSLSGFTARINVRLNFATLITDWDGTYAFIPVLPVL